jgi:tetratricopeptide (TPR) repeat protein
MYKSSMVRLAAAALLACACAPLASAQSTDAKGAESAVRERRANPPEAQKGSTETAEAAPAEEAPRAEEAGSPAERARQRQAAAQRLAESGNKAEAVAMLRTMAAEERFDPPFFYNTGNALARLGESEAAVGAYRKAVAQRRGNYSRAQHNLGVVLTRLGRWEEAEEALSAALKLESYNYAEASYSLGRLHALKGESDLAVAEWGRTLRLKPDHTDAAVSLARLLSESGDTTQALAVLDALTERLNRRGAAVPREITVARGEMVAAANLLADESHARDVDEGRAVEGVRAEAAGAKAAAEKVPASLKVSSDVDATAVMRNARLASTRPLVAGREAFDLLRRARAAREGGRQEEALTLYRRAVESNGGYFAPANLELAYTLAGFRRNEEAAASILSVIRREGTRYPIAFYHVGRFYEHMGRFAEAEEAFARASELMGDKSPQFYIDLSRVREREGNYAGALSAAEEYVSLTSRTGTAPPDWARARVEHLRKKTAQPAPAKN